MNNTSVTAGFTDGNTLQLRFELGQIEDASLTDVIPLSGSINPDSGWIWDNGWVGRVQLDGTHYMGLDAYLASDIDDLFDAPDGASDPRAATVDNLSDWTIELNGSEVTIDQLSRKSNILDNATVGWGQYEFRTAQNLFFDLDQTLSAGDILTISFDDADFDTITVTYDPSSVISEAIHVNLTGFDPDDPVKTAYLSSWNGWSVDNQTTVAQVYDAPLTYRVIDADTETVVLSGQTELATPASQNSDFDRNFSLTDVWEMDLSSVTQSGSFYVEVDTIGRSQTFEIANDVWHDIFEVSLSGFYHQRSGIALEAQYTDWTQDRSLHPDDGFVTVYASTLKISDTNEGYDGSKPDQFGPLVAGATEEILPDAWGGWHDAGDWDRRTQHLEASRKLIDLVEIAPEFAADFTALIPENTNNLPDILDEALWNMDFFARLQTAEGGVRGGIEGDAYRGYGANSTIEEHTLYAYAPDVWTTWEFAASAAKLSRVIDSYDSAAAATWLERAERAMDWAEARVPSDIDITQQTSRNLAAAELYATTQNSDWHDLFLATSSHAGEPRSLAWNEYQYEAAITYSRLDEELTDAQTAARTLATLTDRADFLLTQGSNGGFGSLIDPYAPYGWGNTASQVNYSTDFMVATHNLTGEQKYLDAIYSDVQYLLGANPQNLVYMTGIDGVRSPEIILNTDADSGHGGTPPPGITIYGDYALHDYGFNDAYNTMWNDIFPNPYLAPVHESFQGYFLFVPSTEYTVQQGITDTTYVTGYLASLAGADDNGIEEVISDFVKGETKINLETLTDSAYYIALNVGNQSAREVHCYDERLTDRFIFEATQFGDDVQITMRDGLDDATPEVITTIENISLSTLDLTDFSF